MLVSLFSVYFFAGKGNYVHILKRIREIIPRVSVYYTRAIVLTGEITRMLLYVLFLAGIIYRALIKIQRRPHRGMRHRTTIHRIMKRSIPRSSGAPPGSRRNRPPGAGFCR